MKQTWLTSMLVDKGVMTEQGLTRRAKLIAHRPCGIPTLAGLDSDLAGLDAWCDLGELTRYGEAMALLEGRRTYQLHGGRLSLRDRWQIGGKPAGGRSPVLASHLCDQSIPATWCTTSDQASLTPTTDGIPF
jgi:hypothetical protein